MRRRRKIIADLEQDAAQAAARAVIKSKQQAVRVAETTTDGVQFAASLLRRKYGYTRQEARLLTEGLNISPTSAIMCDHANEVPPICQCPPWCYCRVHGSCQHDDQYLWDQKDGTVVYEMKRANVTWTVHHIKNRPVKCTIKQTVSDQSNPYTVDTDNPNIAVVSFKFPTTGILYIE